MSVAPALSVALRLGRISNLPTVWTNTLVGVTLAGGTSFDARVPLLMVALSLFYIGGMFLNDAFDREFDARTRPDRPIPAGQVTASTVFGSGFGMLGTVATGVVGSSAPSVSLRAGRDYWITVLEKLAGPVLGHLAKRELKKTMPVEAYNPAERRSYTHLEAFGRLLAGVAPWLELPGPSGDEGRRQNALISMTRAAVDAATADLR
jgi:hypothetical protein